MHLTSTELLRVRDGRMYVIGVANPKPLRDLRAHVGSCLACTQALLDLHAAESSLKRRAERAPTADTAGELAEELALTAMRERRAARARAAGIGASVTSGGISLRRRALVGLLVCAVFAVTLYVVQSFVLTPGGDATKAAYARTAPTLAPIIVSLQIADAPESAARPKAALPMAAPRAP